MKRKHRIIRRNGQRIAWTNTSTIGDEEIIDAIKWLTAEVDLDGVVIHFKKCGHNRGSAGRAYSRIPGIANLEGLRRIEWRYLIVVTDYPGWFDTLAHEAKHVEQFRERLPIRERQANRFAKRMAAKRISTRSPETAAGTPPRAEG